MKKIFTLLLIIFILLSNVCIYATAVEDIIGGESEIVGFRKKINEDIASFNDKYGTSYGFVAYILNRFQVWSIPICFAGLIVTGTSTYVINARNLAQRQKGWNMMIGVLLFLVICQILPLAFALATITWG